MPSYTLSRSADQDLVDIYVFTHREFGEQKADTYFASLEESLSNLAANPQLGVDIGEFRKGYRRFVHKRHTIYYKRQRSGILVIRILGPGMSADHHVS